MSEGRKEGRRVLNILRSALRRLVCAYNGAEARPQAGRGRDDGRNMQ